MSGFSFLINFRKSSTGFTSNFDFRGKYRMLVSLQNAYCRVTPITQD